MMETTVPTEDSALGPMIGLRSLLVTIRRNRRVWLMTGLVGLLIGASLHLVIPHKYTADTDLYLAQPAGSDPLQAMAGDVSLLQTEAVARQAVTSGNLHMTPSALLSHYVGLAVSGNLMSIKFSGSSQTEAVSGARAVARAFLAVQARELSLQTDVLVGGLQAQISSVNAAIGTLNTSINSLSDTAANEQSTNQLADLVNQRSADESQVSQFQAQVEQARLSEQSADQVSRVLDPAALVPVSTKKVILVDALSGLVAGLAIGFVAVIFSSLFSDRAPGRSTVAAILGAPVELSLGRYRNPRVMRRTRLSLLLREPDPTLLMIQRRLRRHLESAPGSALAVVADGTPELTALAVGSLAFALSSEGHRVAVVDAAANRPLALILGLATKPDAMETFQLPAAGGPSVSVLVAPEDPLQMAEKPPPDDTDVLLILASLDAAFGAEHLAPWVTDAVMILSSRRITIPRMDISREMLHEAGISLRAVILLDSDFQDDSSGASSPIDLRLTPAGTAEPSK
jgi:capsular polysaccharide biosynthesis protein